MPRENAKFLREAVQKLPPEYRLILVLHDMEDLRDTDIAEITGSVLGPFASACTARGFLCVRN